MLGRGTYKKGKTMNKNILFVLALSWILASCVSQAPLFVGSQVGNRTLSISGCVPYVGPMQACTGDENAPKVKIDLDTMVVDPMCIKAKKGKKIEFMLKSTGDIEKGSVVVFPKKVENFSWIARTNWPNKNKITVTVPETKNKSKNPLPAGDYYYGVLAPNGCLDPRINVIN